jgi:hypothetical protein
MEATVGQGSPAAVLLKRKLNLHVRMMLVVPVVEPMRA